jgi:hypothetical protein
MAKEFDPTHVSREEAERKHEQYEYACRVAGDSAARIEREWTAFIVTFRSANNITLREEQSFQLDDFCELGPRKFRIVARPTATISMRGYIADVERMLSRQSHVSRFERSDD